MSLVRRSRAGLWLFNDHIGIGSYHRYYWLTLRLEALGRVWWLRIPRRHDGRP